MKSGTLHFICQGRIDRNFDVISCILRWQNQGVNISWPGIYFTKSGPPGSNGGPADNLLKEEDPGLDCPCPWDRSLPLAGPGR